MIPEFHRKFSRRALGRWLAVSAAAVPPASPQRSTTAEERQRASQRVQRSSQSMAKFELPMATEPSFVFRP
jgi:hypothetical protein